MTTRKTYENSNQEISFGDNIIPETNPKVFECDKADLIYEDNRIKAINGIRFTCDNCSSPMVVVYGPYGFFIGCIHWKESEACKKNTIKLKVNKNE